MHHPPILSSSLTDGDGALIASPEACALTRVEHRRLAELLIRAARDRRAIEPLTQVYPEMTDADADSVRDMTIMLRVAGGERVAGAKVVHLDEPRLGWFTDRMVQSQGSVDHASLIRPRIEAKLALTLAERADRPPDSVEELLAAADRLIACVEVVDSRYDTAPIGIRDAVADNCSTAVLVVCDEIPAAALASRRCAASLLWLTSRIIRHRGQIEADTLLVGPPLGGSAPLASGQRVDAGLARRMLREQGT